MNWKTSWKYLKINYKSAVGTIENATQRVWLKNNINGNQIRVKFSNLYSKEPLILDQVVIGKKKKDNPNIESFKTLTKNGIDRIVIEAGDSFYSDVLDFDISAGDEIVLSIYIKEKTEICGLCATWAAKSWHTVIGLHGNYTKDQTFEGFDSVEQYSVLNEDEDKGHFAFGFEEIQVCTEDNVKTVALFGDSITHMSYYSDALIEKAYQEMMGDVTILNYGIGGNRLLRDHSDMPELHDNGMRFGEAGIKRFHKDVYGSGIPEYVIILIGINDITHPYALHHEDEAITLETYKEGIKALIDSAHEKGSQVFLGTLTPIKAEGNDWYEPSEKLRSEINVWIRTQTLSDRIIDFDKATRKPEKPKEMFDDSHLGDGLHPNLTGGKRMADAIKLEWFLLGQ